MKRKVITRARLLLVLYAAILFLFVVAAVAWVRSYRWHDQIIVQPRTAWIGCRSATGRIEVTYHTGLLSGQRPGCLHWRPTRIVPGSGYMLGYGSRWQLLRFDGHGRLWHLFAFTANTETGRLDGRRSWSLTV